MAKQSLRGAYAELTRSLRGCSVLPTLEIANQRLANPARPSFHFDSQLFPHIYTFMLQKMWTSTQISTSHDDFCLRPQTLVTSVDRKTPILELCHSKTPRFWRGADGICLRTHREIQKPAIRPHLFLTRNTRILPLFS